MKRLAKKVLLIGWDAADWKFLNPLMDQGLMPNLSKLVENGASGKLATLDPPLSPTLWTSIATGKRPYKHGIHGFTEVDPSGNGVRPIYSSSRKVKAIWNMLDQHDLKSNIVGWWPSHPAEAINGAMVSNFYQRPNKVYGSPWEMAKGTVYPSELTDTLAELRVHPKELTGAHIQPFVPDAWKIDEKRDRRLDIVAKITAECSSIHAAATYLMEHKDWDFMGVYFDAIDHYCHGFMKFHPPYREHIVKEDYELFKNVVNGGCRYHDMMLGRLLDLAGEDTTIILISDHGFHPDHNRPVIIPKEPAGPAIEHSPFGIIVMNGPGIKKDGLLFGASLLDITPTLLSLFGLPVGEDMDGKVLLHAFEEKPEVETIKTWEDIGAKAEEEAVKTQSKEEMAAELQQLIDLGYIEDPGKDAAQAIKKTQDENNYYLARAYINGGEWEEGIKLLKALHTEYPKTLRYASRLADAYQDTGQYKLGRKIINHIRDTFDRESPQLDILEGTLLLSEHRHKKALELFKKAEREAGDAHHIHLRIATAYIQLNKLDDAERALEKALELDPEHVGAWHELGINYYEKGDYEEAIQASLRAVGLMYYFPMAHFYIGKSLEQLERYEEAVEAYDTCLRIAPALNAARKNIISIFEKHLDQPGRAFKYKTDFENKIQGEITIVSGLPRSGTSMMMQMLEAGGLPIFTDKERTADDSNPKGYYEHEVVKSLAKNKKWIPKAKDKAVKIIAQLLEHLPMNYRYKIIFMERNLYEVVQSQQNMLIRNDKKVKEDVLPLALIDAYEKTIKEVDQWVAEHPNVELLKVPYREIIEAPFAQAIKVRGFLDSDLEVEKMAQVVDSKLYRERVVKS